jgi:catechol 2,3-dioxygenase-like lactoylglutathione lyase family enzyme
VLRTFRAAGTADYLASGGRIEIVRLMAEGTRAPKLRVCMAGATMTSAAGESSGSGFDDNSVANPARPASLSPGRDGNPTLAVKDPEGRAIEFVQYQPRSATPAAERGISEHIIHAGFIVQDRAAEDRFYKDTLGFTEMWHGGKTDTDISWVDMRVPDGDDWLEYMLNIHNPTAKTRGVMNHLALGVPDMAASYKRLTDRGVNLQEKPKIGRDGKWQLNLYDPNLTRVELMEPKPVETPCCSPMKTR